MIQRSVARTRAPVHGGAPAAKKQKNDGEMDELTFSVFVLEHLKPTDTRRSSTDCHFLDGVFAFHYES